ncbi:Hypothetical predicted protein [Lecanosticta acicola]|uniref:Mediator complex subunit 15 KIX domain-containing protein n=1 Tax=Lecanosticta acicola TaxID=111012 RepID=A0AAI8Z4J7_9PEZI|nr:Hypothetical predicted protein [Lecanosticta acicola]
MEMPNNMPGGMPGPVNNTMQRPQPNNPNQQINAKIMADLRNGLASLQGGWQATMNVGERTVGIMQLYDALFTMLRGLNQQNNPWQCLHIAQQWERRTILNSPNKETYYAEMDKKFQEITAKRKEASMNQMNSQGGGGMIPNMTNPGNMQTGAMNMQNGMGHVGPFPNRAAMGQSGQMNAQAQMQAQHSQQPPTTMDPSALQMPPQQPAQQPQGQNMSQPSQSQQPNMNQGGQGQPPTIQQRVLAVAQKLHDSMPEEQRNAMRQKLMATMSDQQRRELKMDPVMRFFVAKATQQFTAQNRQQQQQQQQQQQMSGGAANGQQVNQAAPSGGNPNAQMGNGPPRPPSQADGQSIDFSGIMGQQANALKSQESGEQVVPASNNNNMGFGGQVNMSQGVNPAMLGNQGNQANQNTQNNQGGQTTQNNQQGGQLGNGTMNQSQMQFFMQQQREAQQRERMQKQIMAQQHAIASRQQLQGQPGGLHTPNAFNGGPNGQVNSPAMSMLNRPMAPPGQTTPGTPQPNRQRPTPQTPMANDANQLAQHHQNMLAQNSQQQQQLQQLRQGGQAPQGLNVDALLARVPPQYREKLANMPPEQIAAFVQKWEAMGWPPLGPFGLNNPNMAQMQQGNQQGQQGMPVQPMGNAIPGFNAQPPANQGAMNNTQQQVQAQIRTQQGIRLRTQALDSRPFPRSILTQLSIAAPPHVQTWGDLKQHVSQNPQAATVEKVQQQQAGWFQANPQEYAVAMQAIMQQRARLQQQAQQGRLGQGGQPQPPNAPQAAGTMPAPPAQMVPPRQMMQQPAGQGMPAGFNMAQLQPSPQEIAAFRARFQQFQAASDDQVRSMLVGARIKQMRQQQQQRQQAQNGQVPGPPNQQIGGPQPNMQNGAAPVPRMPPGTQGQPGALGQQQPSSQSNNDIIEISSQPAAKATPQAPAMQPSQSQQQAPAQRPASRLSQQEPVAKAPEGQKQQQQYIQKMAQQQSAQMESIRKAQGQMGAQTHQPAQAASASNRPAMPQPPRMSQADQERLGRMNQEVVRENPRGPPVQIDKAGMDRMKHIFKKLWNPLKHLPTTFPVALAYGFEDKTLKDVMRARLIVHQNIMDDSGSIKDYLSVTPEQLKDIERAVVTYMTELKIRKEQHDAQRQQQTAAGSKVPPTQAQTGKAQAAPMAQSSSQQNHARKNSKPPPAPTENKTFDWAAPSPHGVPKYEPGRNELTPDKLKFPPQKKRKTDQSTSQASTPAAQVSTPAAMGASPALVNGKIQSPEQTRKTPAQLKAEAERDAEQRKFRCKDSTCDASLRGFETEDQLKQHEQSHHQVIENPLNFLLDNAANALGVDKEGNALREPGPPRKKMAPGASAKRRIATARDLKKEELTKLEMEQINRGLTPASVKSKIAKKQAEFDAATQKDPGKEMTLREHMSQKLDIALPAEPATENVSLKPEAVESILKLDNADDELVTWEKLAQNYAEGWIPNEMDHDVWEYRPSESIYTSDPELTPNGSEISQASQSSDVSQSDAMKFVITMENWDADIWGDGSGGAPESLIPLYRQIKDMMNEDGDAVMGGMADGGDSPHTRKRKAEEAWELPVQDAWDEFINQSASV